MNMDKEKIIEHFGAEFYNKVLNDLEKYSNLWSLSEFEHIDYYSVNCNFKCVSAKYGLCVLKIGKPSNVTQTEYQILQEYKGGGKFCEVYEADIANGVLLIERITPGIQLRDELNFDKRLDVFCDLFHGLHIEPVNKTIYPTYMEWVSKITEYMKNCGKHEELCEKMIRAEQICRSLFEKYRGEMLLHGDLHHENILLGEDNRYRIIDPKGVIGDSVFDIPRFILNEFEYDTYVKVTKTLSEKLNISEYDIRRLVYMELCMAFCWCVEGGDEPSVEEIDMILFVEKLMEEME